MGLKLLRGELHAAEQQPAQPRQQQQQQPTTTAAMAAPPVDNECREEVLRRELAAAEREVARARGEARLANAALSSRASEAVRAHLAIRMAEEAA